MPLDATVGGASANSYVTLSQANDYFAAGAHLRSAEWLALSNSVREACLLSATRWLDVLRYFGQPVSTTQALRFPRVYENWPVDAIPRRVRDACCEQALHLASNPNGYSKRQELQAQGVVSYTIGELTEMFGGPRVNSGTAEHAVCDAAKALLRGFVSRGGRTA
jgi:hypothetical protein